MQDNKSKLDDINNQISVIEMQIENLSKIRESLIVDKIYTELFEKLSNEKSVYYKGRKYNLLWFGKTKYGYKAKLSFLTTGNIANTFYVDLKKVSIVNNLARKNNNEPDYDYQFEDDDAFAMAFDHDVGDRL